MFIIVGMYHKLQSVFTKESRRAGNPEQLACFFYLRSFLREGLSSYPKRFKQASMSVIRG
jgi:hypothetical protein